MSKSQIIVKKLSLVRESVKSLNVRSGIQTGDSSSPMLGPTTGPRAPTKASGYANSKSNAPV